VTGPDVLAHGHLEHVGYLGVALLVCIEGFGIPSPGQTAVIVAAAYAGNGHLNIAAVVAVALLGTIAGDNIGYLIGHFAGRRVVLRYGRYVRLTAERLERVEAFVHRRGPAVITIARFVEGLRQLNGIVCGSTGLPWRRFASFDALGAVAWVGVWATAGYLAGNHLDAVEATLRRNLWLGIAAVILLIVAYGLFHRSRKRRRDTV
jgi:membrane protein DedA with SNARE-associated domain